MKALVCPRSFEVEALRDGRLAGKERRDFERHVQGCAACRAGQGRLEELVALLRKLEPREDELRVRRERVRLLAAFDRSLVEHEPKQIAARKWIWALVAVLGLSVLAVLRSGLFSSPATSGTEIVAAPGATWSRRTDAQRDLVVLERGELRVRVARSEGVGPLLVLLPDGELEDIGTVFTVEVEAEKTTRVVVTEGAVLLRLHGQAPIVIRPESSWNRSPPEADPRRGEGAVQREGALQPEGTVQAEGTLQPEGTVQLEALPSPSEAPAESKRSAPASSAVSSEASPPPTASSTAPPAVASAPPAPPSAGNGSTLAAEEFRLAMAAYRGGQHAQAALLLGRFLERFPRDPRAQDAAYVRILALQAAGQRDAMRSACDAYLRAYPRGFRRAEVEKLAR